MNAPSSSQKQSISSNSTTSKEEKDVDFKPSGIAIHPMTGQIYMISSVGKLLVVLNKNRDLSAKYALDKDVFKQPEGICFSPDGDLYISNEGRGKSANILHFKFDDK